MEEYLDLYKVYLINEKNVSKNTQLAYMRDIKNLIGFIETLSVNDFQKVNATHINAYILKQENDQLSVATISRRVAVIHKFFEYLIEQKVIKDNPSKLITAPRVTQKMPETLELHEVEALLNQPEKDKKGIRDKAMLELLYGTGIRVSELLALEVQDVNMNLSFIHCNRGKNNRIIPFGSKAHEALENYLNNIRKKMLKGKEDNILFVNCFGKSMTRQGFWKIIKTYAKKADIDKRITPQILRHSFGVHLIENGANIKAVQEMMGHLDIASTQKYIDKKKSRINEVYKAAHPRA